METVRVLMNISGIERKASEYESDFMEEAYSMVASQLWQELSLSENGYVEDFDEVEDKLNFVDGSKTPQKIIDEGKTYYRKYVKNFVEKVEEISQIIHSSGNFEKELLRYFDSNGFEFFINTCQLTGFVSDCTDKIYAEHDGCLAVGPSENQLKNVMEHPEDYVSFDVPYQV